MAANCTDSSGGGIAEISPLRLAASYALVLAVALVSYACKMHGFAVRALIASVRMFLQLLVLGYILLPIFKHGEDKAYIPIIYLFLWMASVAGVEAAARSPYTYDRATLHVWLSMLVALAFHAIYAFGVVIQPAPLYSPQYLIPVGGMLLGNSINGISKSPLKH